MASASRQVADFDGDGDFDEGLQAADLDRDGDLDVLINGLNHSKAAGWTKQVIGTTGNHSMRIVDLDGDGAPSLFGANHQEKKVELWRTTTRRGKLSLDH